MSFITINLYDQSDEFNVIGQQVSYCRRPSLCNMPYIALEQHNARGPQAGQ